jgi:hypothetical protein
MDIDERRTRAAQLDLELISQQGATCLMPGCSEPWAQKAHIVPSGMGGRPSTFEADNLVGLCVYHHDVFDGRQLEGRQLMLRTLMKILKLKVRDSRRLLQ